MVSKTILCLNYITYYGFMSELAYCYGFPPRIFSDAIYLAFLRYTMY